MNNKLTTALLLSAFMAACGPDMGPDLSVIPEDAPGPDMVFDGPFGTTVSYLLPTGTVYYVNDIRDECLDDPADCSIPDGDCSIREAYRAQGSSVWIDQCPPGMPNTYVDQIFVTVTGTTVLAGNPGDNNNLGGDLDLQGHNIEVYGPPLGSNGRPTWFIDAHGVDRGSHSTGAGSQSQQGLHNVEIFGGCANGGTCATQGPTGPAIGGGHYQNSAGYFRMSHVIIRNARANANGSALAFCAPATFPTDCYLSDVDLYDNDGTAAVWTHVNCTFERVRIYNNVMDIAGTRFSASLDISNKRTTCIDCEIYNNTNLSYHVGGPFVRGEGGTSRGEFFMTGGRLDGNTANGKGANFGINGGQGGIDIGWGAQCAQAPGQTYGCLARFENVYIGNGTADYYAASYTGNGGGLEINGTTGAAYPSAGGRVEARGLTVISDNNDIVRPGPPTDRPFAPDCAGTIHTSSTVVIGNPTGCTIIQDL